MRKTYVALVQGRIAPAGRVDARLKTVFSLGQSHKTYVHPRGKEAATRFKVRGARPLRRKRTNGGLASSGWRCSRCRRDARRGRRR